MGMQGALVGEEYDGKQSKGWAASEQRKNRNKLTNHRILTLFPFP